MKKLVILCVLLLSGLVQAQRQDFALPPTNIAEPMTVDNAENAQVITTTGSPLFLPIAQNMSIDEGQTILHLGNFEDLALWNLELSEEIPVDITELDAPDQEGDVTITWQSRMSPDGRWLVLSQYDVTFPPDVSAVELYNIQTGTLEATLSSTGWPIRSIVIDAENTVYYTDCAEDVVQEELGISCSAINLFRWDSDSGTALDPIADIPNSNIVDVNVTAGRAISVGTRRMPEYCDSDDTEERCLAYVYVLYDLANFEVIQNFEILQTEGRSDGDGDAMFSPDGSRLVISNPEKILVIDPDSGEEIATYEGFESAISSIAFSPNSDLIAVATGQHWDSDNSVLQIIEEEHGIHLIEAETGDLKSFISLLPDNASPNDYYGYLASSMTFTPDSRLLLFSNSAGIGLVGVPNDALCTITASSTVNTRQLPTTQSAQQEALLAGSDHFADGQTTGSDGFVWWRLLDGRWVRSDVVQAAANCDELPQVEPEE